MVTIISFISRRTVNVVNLDPAAEYFDYQPLVDIRDLVNAWIHKSNLHNFYLHRKGRP